MRERFERAHPGEIESAEEAGRVAHLGLDQRHLDPYSARRQIFGDRRAADTAADYDDSRAGWASRHWRGDGREARRSHKRAELATCPAIHGCSDPIFRVARYSASAAISSVLSDRATTLMIWLERLPDLKASIASLSFFGLSPMIEGMPWSRPSRR